MHSAHSSYPQESLALGRTVVNIEKNIKTLYGAFVESIVR